LPVCLLDNFGPPLFIEVKRSIHFCSFFARESKRTKKGHPRFFSAVFDKAFVSLFCLSKKGTKKGHPSIFLNGI